MPGEFLQLSEVRILILVKEFRCPAVLILERLAEALNELLPIRP